MIAGGIPEAKFMKMSDFPIYIRNSINYKTKVAVKAVVMSLDMNLGMEIYQKADDKNINFPHFVEIDRLCQNTKANEDWLDEFEQTCKENGVDPSSQLPMTFMVADLWDPLLRSKQNAF